MQSDNKFPSIKALEGYYLKNAKISAAMNVSISNSRYFERTRDRPCDQNNQYNVYMIGRVYFKVDFDFKGRVAVGMMVNSRGGGLPYERGGNARRLA